jgi:hypothetical protein
VWRAGQAQAQGKVADTVSYARRALELVAEDDHLSRGAAAALLTVSQDFVAAAPDAATYHISGVLLHAVYR